MFDKALDVSINGIGEQELNECCGGIKGQLGSNIQRVFINVISQSQRKMDESFKNICELNQLEEVLRNSMNAGNPSVSATPNTEDNYSIEGVEGPWNALMLEERQKEKERITIAIQQLDSDVRRTKDLLHKLKSQVQNEIAAATEECQKMSLAAAQIGKLTHTQ